MKSSRHSFLPASRGGIRTCMMEVRGGEGGSGSCRAWLAVSRWGAPSRAAAVSEIEHPPRSRSGWQPWQRQSPWPCECEVEHVIRLVFCCSQKWFGAQGSAQSLTPALARLDPTTKPNIQPDMGQPFAPTSLDRTQVAKDILHRTRGAPYVGWAIATRRSTWMARGRTPHCTS